jgi:hypothetical protein
MMTNNFVLVDTNIWKFGLVKPREKEFSELYESAHGLLFSLLADKVTRIGMSAYQVGEILETLRKSGIEREERLRIADDFKKPKFYIADVTLNDVFRAVTDSVSSNIHVYDYLVAYPLRDVVSRIYSADKHFMHEDFRSICEVTNPVSPWFEVEGRRPEKSARDIH